MSKKAHRNYVLYKLRKKNYTSSETYWAHDRLSYGELINTIARKEHWNPGSVLEHLTDDFENTYLKSRMVKDTRFSLGYYIEREDIYIITKENHGEVTILTAADLRADVEKQIKVVKDEWEKRADKRAYERKLRNNYEFRKGPVPFVHKVRGNWLRHPATSNSKRNNFYYDEYTEKNFSDFRIRTLPSAYDDIIRHTDRSWKTSCKVRKQWQKHDKKHIDTVKIKEKTLEDFKLENIFELENEIDADIAS